MQYALIKNGTVQNVIEADAEFADSIAADWESVQSIAAHHDGGLLVGIGWGWGPGGFVAPEPVAEQMPAPAQRHLSQLGFLNRFTDEEAIGIDLASIGATVEAAGMRRYTAKIQAAKFIDLDMSDTRNGVQALEAAGLIAPGRALEILDAAVQEGERP